jgi:hypothetical protein
VPFSTVVIFDPFAVTSHVFHVPPVFSTGFAFVTLTIAPVP